jgi:gluconolactonase
MMKRRTFMSFSTSALAAAVAAPRAWSKEDGQQAVVRYPDSTIETVHPRFEKYCLINAAVERLWTGARWAEGPVWIANGRYLLFMTASQSLYALYVNTRGAQLL